MAMIHTDAWVLHKAGPNHPKGELLRETFTFNEISETEVLAEPLYGCWEGNMGHAVARQPVDIAAQRGEDKVVVGNAGVVRILQTGAAVTTCKPGDVCIVFCIGIVDQWGYPIKIMAYDAPGTMGVLAKTIKMPGHSVIPIPRETRYSLAQWAGFSLRYVTAWSNHKVAYRCWRSQMEQADPAQHWVLSWGGGVSFAQCVLAKEAGFHVLTIASGKQRLETAKQAGFQTIDRTTLDDLQYNPHKYDTDSEYRQRYIAAEKNFVKAVLELSDGKGMDIIIDYIGLPVYRASLKVLARQGVITTAGWKEGMVLTNYRAIECINRHIHVHTHYANYAEGLEAVAYAEAHGWLPEIRPEEIYAFDDIPQLLADYNSNKLSYFPIFKVNET